MTITLPAAAGPTRRRHRRLVGLVVLVLITLCVAALSITVGSRDIPAGVVWDALTAFDATDSRHLLVRDLRVPRALNALVVGVALGVAGAMMQSLTRNPLAEPGLLGINAGAAAAIAVGISFLGITGVSGYLVLGLVGAALASVAVFLLGGVRNGTNPVRLVLSGAALTAVLSALTTVVLLNSNEEVFDRYRNWMVGSLAGRGTDVLVAVGLLAAVGVGLALAQSRALDAVALGEDTGRALGADPGRTWALAGVVVVILAGAATAAAGPIVFLGLAAPHLARLLVGVDHRWLLPYSGAIAAALIVLADALGRLVAPPGEVPVGIMVAIIGGPFFIILVRRRKLVQL
ncbi:iron ABC transporter permease [Dietzia sp. CH92]|uniref:FecCD family ABC transporter permease n=1 Tax=Dietzia sp. CH92 TaxID=3051823 RepID=UPI0028D6350E|nr:iron ABC transporter permease [Dietzia sp. CH92]